MFFFTVTNHYVSIRCGSSFVFPLSVKSQIDYAFPEGRKKESFFKRIYIINREENSIIIIN